MPDIKLFLFSQRARHVDDRVKNLRVKGRHFRFIPPSDVDAIEGGLLLDVPPDTYRLEFDIDGFKHFRARLVARKAKTMRGEVRHRCTLLPIFGQLEEEQKRLLRSSPGSGDGRVKWRNLSDNQACTIFQVTYALAHTSMGDAMLSEYIQKVQRIGGAEIEGPSPDGKTKRATGWRLHVRIKPSRQGGMVGALGSHGFKRDTGFVHPTHTKFGFTKSFRQQGRNPRLQVVLTPDVSGADIDLDNGAFHRSSPHEVYKALKKKFSDVQHIYQVR